MIYVQFAAVAFISLHSRWYIESIRVMPTGQSHISEMLYFTKVAISSISLFFCMTCFNHPPSVRRFAPAIQRMQRTSVAANKLAPPPAADPRPRYISSGVSSYSWCVRQCENRSMNLKHNRMNYDVELTSQASWYSHRERITITFSMNCILKAPYGSVLTPEKNEVSR